MMINELTPKELYPYQKDYILVDVREPFELSGPDGSIDGATLASLGSDFLSFLESAPPEKSYVFICKSGYRSRQACAMANAYGILKANNLAGGIVAWNEYVKALSSHQN